MITQLQGWFLSKAMFSKAPKPSTNAYKLPVVDKQAKKEAKWRDPKKALVKELVAVYTDGSAKRVQGWMQAGYGVWYALASSRNLLPTCTGA